MPKTAPPRFFDSCVILRLLENRPEADIIDSLFQQAASGQWMIVVTAVTLLEVSRPPGRYDPAKHAKVMDFFENDFIYVHDLDILLAQKAQALIYQYNWLKPMDAAHLAAAIDVGCQAFYTYDTDVLRFDTEHGLRVMRPGEPLHLSLTDTEGLPLFQPPPAPS